MNIAPFKMDFKSSLVDLLHEVPRVQVSAGVKKFFFETDIEILLETPEGKRQIVVDVKSSGEPKHIREACAYLNSLIKNRQSYYPVVAAPYITSRAALICKEMDVGYLDLSGNCRLVFDSIFIERQGFQNKKVEKRPLRSIFSTKSSRVVRMLLEDPFKHWQVQEFAETADISLGLASKVKHRLLDLDYVTVSSAGIQVREPELLLQEWSKEYSYKDNEILGCYSPGSPSENEKQLSEYCLNHNLKYALTLFSASNRIAPFVRGISQSAIYVDCDNLESVAKKLDWKPVSSGPNILLMKPSDEFILRGIQTKSEWLYPVVDDLQLYLDLSNHQTRGQEAAEFLLEQHIKPRWEAALKRV